MNKSLQGRTRAHRQRCAHWRGFQRGGGVGWIEIAAALVTRRRGGVAGWLGGAESAGLGSGPLPLDDWEIAEVEVAGGWLGPGGGQGWSASREAEAAQDGADRFLRLDGGEQAHPGSTARAGEGIDREDALKQLSPREPSRAAGGRIPSGVPVLPFDPGTSGSASTKVQEPAQRGLLAAGLVRRATRRPGVARTRARRLPLRLPCSWSLARAVVRVE